MHGKDITPDVQNGLAWYFLLAALLNVGAALHWVYWSRGKKLLNWESMLLAAGGVGFGILAVGWMFGLPSPALYVIAMLATIPGILVALPASVYQKVRAATVWTLCALLFLGLGLVYTFVFPNVVLNEIGPNRKEVVFIVHEAMPLRSADSVEALLDKLPIKISKLASGEEAQSLVKKLKAAGAAASAHSGAPKMPESLRDAIDSVAGPVTFFFGSVAAFAGFFYFRCARVVQIPIGRESSPGGGSQWKTFDIRVPFGFTDPPVMWGILCVVLLFFGLAMTDVDFRHIVAKPDNVPITIMLFSVGFCTWLFLRKAVINDQRLAEGLRPLEAEEQEKVLVWPDLVYTELIAMVVCTVILVLWSVLLRAPLEEWANLTKTPNPSKAPWYFLGLQEMLVYYDPWAAGVVFPSLIIFGLMAIPYIDFNKEGAGYFTFVQRKFSILVFTFGFVVLWVLMVVLGTFLRGPGWNFFGPFKFWDPHMVLPLNNIDLSDFFWVRWLGRGKPAWFVWREMPGFLAIAAYFFVLPPLLAKSVFKSFFEKMGFARFNVFVFLALWMAALPIKMLLRWSFNLKYIVHIDEIFFNI